MHPAAAPRAPHTRAPPPLPACHPAANPPHVPLASTHFRDKMLEMHGWQVRAGLAAHVAGVHGGFRIPTLMARRKGRNGASVDKSPQSRAAGQKARTPAPLSCHGCPVACTPRACARRTTCPVVPTCLHPQFSLNAPPPPPPPITLGRFHPISRVGQARRAGAAAGG